MRCTSKYWRCHRNARHHRGLVESLAKEGALYIGNYMRHWQTMAALYLHFEKTVIGHSDFNCRGYSMDASLPDSERLLGFQLQKGASVIEVTACTKQPHNASKGPANEVHLIRTDPCSRYRSKFCVHQALVVNLDRRREKYETFKRRAWQTTQLRDGIDFSRFSAIDGKRLQPNLPAHLRKIFSLDGYNPFERFRTNPHKDHGHSLGPVAHYQI